MEEYDSPTDDRDLFDRGIVFLYQHQTSTESSKYLYLVKASSSVLLTLAVPDISDSQEEEINLLRDPQALWTVLAVNAPSNFASEQELADFYTPIAQFTRGVASSVRTQRLQAESIYDRLKDDLDGCDPEGLFDDDKFKKSNLYHQVVKTCDASAGSIASSLRFVSRAYDSEGHLSRLCANAHDYERRGVEYWVRQVQDEIFALKELQSQLSLLCSQVHERVSLYSPSSFVQS